MQIKTAGLALRQQLPEELLMLVRGRVMPSEEGEGVKKGPGQAAAEKVVEPASPGQTERAVREINEGLKIWSTSLHFEVDQDAGKTIVIVKVIDKESGDILRQIPSEEAVRIAKSLDKLTGHLVHHAV